MSTATAVATAPATATRAAVSPSASPRIFAVPGFPMPYPYPTEPPPPNILWPPFYPYPPPPPQPGLPWRAAPPNGFFPVGSPTPPAWPVGFPWPPPPANLAFPTLPPGGAPPPGFIPGRGGVPTGGNNGVEGDPPLIDGPHVVNATSTTTGATNSSQISGNKEGSVNVPLAIGIIIALIIAISCMGSFLWVRRRYFAFKGRNGRNLGTKLMPMPATADVHEDGAIGAPGPVLLHDFTGGMNAGSTSVAERSLAWSEVPTLGAVVEENYCLGIRGGGNIMDDHVRRGGNVEVFQQQRLEFVKHQRQYQQQLRQGRDEQGEGLPTPYFLVASKVGANEASLEQPAVDGSSSIPLYSVRHHPANALDNADGAI